MYKAGAAYPREIRQYFNPFDYSHIIAFHQYELTGRWPAGSSFNDEGEVWFMDNSWHEEIKRQLSSVPVPPKVTQFLAEFERVKGIIDNISFPKYEFVLEPLGDSFTVHVRYDEPDVLSGVMEEQNGRKWLFPAGQTEGQVAQTCLKALLTSLEHRARENFLYCGKPVLQPHLDMQQLLKMLADRTHHVTAVEFGPEGHDGP